jgi:hypothetical protein
MTKEELEKEAIKRVDAFIDTLSQDVRSTLYNRLNQEDVKDFLYGVYIDSAEPREKRIAKLEQENKELKTVKILQLERKIASIRGAHSVDCRKLNARTEQVERLKKENAELKKKNGNLVASSKTIISLSDEIEARTMNQLTKAKELVKSLIDILKIIEGEQTHEMVIVKEAEQFLKEVEKENEQERT